MAQTNQKGSLLEGGSATDEVIASSDSIFTPNSFGAGQKGLQQFYSPRAASDLAKKVFGSRVAVLDPTAGDGSLLAAFDPPFSYGVEIDKDQIDNSTGSYHAIHGDLQHVFPLLHLSTNAWTAIAANPPFGLMWQDDSIRGGKPTNSAVMTFLYMMRLLSDDGQFMFMDGKNHFYRAIADLPEAAGIYAVVECDDLFESAAHPTVIAFGINPGNRSAGTSGYAKRAVTVDMLDLLGDWVLAEREKALGPRNYVGTVTYDHYSLPDGFSALNKEYRRRVENRLKKGREFDAQLVGGKLIQWLPSGFCTMALRKAGDQHAFEGLNKSAVTYFAQNERLWVKMLNFEEQGVLLIDPRLKDVVESIVGEIRKEIVPLYAVKPQQRLGFLTDVEFIKCIADAPEHGFVAGESYRLHTKTAAVETREKRVVPSKKNPGDFVEKDIIKRQKAMHITIGRWTFMDSGQGASENIQYLLDHFELPDPGEIATRHPKEIARLEDTVRTIFEETFLPNSRKWEEDNPKAFPFSIRQFQVDDIARLLFKKRGLLAWEQGLGKMLGGIAFSEGAVALGAQDARLFIVPGDLVDQWQREIKRMLGKEATIITSHGHAHQIARELKMGGKGIYIAHYELLSMVGTRGKNGSRPMPTIPVYDKEENKQVKGTGRYGYFWRDFGPDGQALRDDGGYPAPVHLCTGHHDEEGLAGKPESTPIEYGYIPEQYETITKTITSKEVCPECRSDVRNGWNGLYCEGEDDKGQKCGYVHFAVRVKPIASLLSTAFERGVIVMDEITLIQGDTAARSKALRGLRANYRLGMSGTPIKNYIRQAFWPLWWSLGNASKRFGYGYENGYTKFENDFSVIEWENNGGKRENRKALPEVTNLSIFWRTLASSTIRRRKEETGEVLVPRFHYEIKTPLGIAQRAQMDKWLKDFPKLFEEKYPDSKVVKAGMHEIMAPMLGLQQKLDYACTIPLADPDHAWTGLEVSNWTPNTLRTLELAMALAAKGRKVLVGSNLIATSQFLAETLIEKGVRAIHILDDDGKTADKKKRAQRVYSFQTDDVQVFCAGVKAIRLGHNLDAADAVILHGVDWDYETLDQFVNRVHRLTSRNPIDVYAVLPVSEAAETFTVKKWGILSQKGQSIELALDGRLIEKHDTEIDQAQIVREMMERGINSDGDELDEDEVQQAWLDVAPFESYVAPDDLIPAPPIEITDDGKTAAQAVGDFLAALAPPQPAAPSLEDGLIPPATPEEIEEFLTTIEAEMPDGYDIGGVQMYEQPAGPEPSPALVVPDSLVLEQIAHEMDTQAPEVEEALAIAAEITDEPLVAMDVTQVEQLAQMMKDMQDQLEAVRLQNAELAAEVERLSNNEQLTLEGV